MIYPLTLLYCLKVIIYLLSQETDKETFMLMYYVVIILPIKQEIISIGMGMREIIWEVIYFGNALAFLCQLDSLSI